MDLQELLGEELYEQVQNRIAEVDEDVKLLVNDGSYVPRDRLNAKNEEIEALKKQIDERDGQIDQLKNDTQSSEELQAKIEELQEQNKKTQQELEQQLHDQRIESEVDKVLLKNKARNPKAVKALLDMESVELDGDEVKGIDEQIDQLVENEPYLFESDEPEGTSRGGEEFKTRSQSPDDDPMRDTLRRVVLGNR